MGFVAVETRELCFVQMNPVLANLALISMTSSETIIAFHFDLAMGLMAIKTVEFAHGRRFRVIFMAPKTAFTGDHLWCAFGKTMTVYTVQALHPHAVYQLILMTFLTGVPSDGKGVQVSNVAFITSDPMHKHVPGVTV